MPGFSVKQLAVLLLAATYSLNISAWNSLTGQLAVNCDQNQTIYLDCFYRPLFPGKVDNIEASHFDRILPVSRSISTREDVTAIYFLIDTSDPARDKVVQKNTRQIERFLAASNNSHRIGLASFDKKLRIHAPLGSSNSKIINSMANIKARGRTTELYRNLLLTIEKLSRTNSKRKAIYLFSDGQAEDKAYFHRDVINAARKHGVVINSVGFPRSVSLSVALQTLRRLSEETGGVFIEADNNFDLEEKHYRAPYKNLDVGDDFRVDLTEISKTNTQQSPTILLSFDSDIGKIELQVPVKLPVMQPAAVSTVLTSPAPAPSAPEVRIVQTANEPASINYWLWYGLPISIVLLFLISIITLILVYRKQPDKDSFIVSSSEQNKPFAYLVTQEEDSIRYPITSTTWRIGRSRDNELSLDDNSVSRMHAEIHRNSDGSFIINDMGSLNGVYVNEEQISKVKLEEGDIIEIGDIYFRFTKLSEDYQLDEDTAIQKTRTPAF